MRKLFPKKLAGRIMALLLIGFFMVSHNSSVKANGYCDPTVQRAIGANFASKCCNEEPQNTTPAPPTSGLPSGSKIYVIGDSLTVGMRDTGLEKKMKDGGWNPIKINAVGGKPLALGIEQLNEGHDRSLVATADAILVGLGTNNVGDVVANDGSANVKPEGVASVKKQMQTIIDEAKAANPNIKIYWTDFYGAGILSTKFGSFNLGAAYNQALNPALQEISKQNGFAVIPWSTSDVAKNSVPNNDVHPNGKYPEMIDFVINSLKNGVAPAGPTVSGTGCCSAGGAPVSGGTVTLSANIPDVWRNLIAQTAPKYPDVDPRLVAAVLWVENRGWPEFKTSGWSVSNAGAAGPWQFIDSTWAVMGTDGDGDGRKDRDNPYDSVHAAFKHHVGSMGKPIAIKGFTSDAEQSFNSTVFERNASNLLYFTAKYNGNGAPDGVKLIDFPRKENADYVIYSYWLLATDFKTVHPPGGGATIDATKAGALFKGGGGGSSGSSTITTAGAGACASNGPASSGAVSAEGYSFPIGPQQKSKISAGYPLPCTTASCHHDGTPAFDLALKALDDTSAGSPEYAISEGTIEKLGIYKGIQGCYAFQLHSSKDSAYYWYGHAQNPKVQEGQKVTAGQQVAEIGIRKCTANGSYPHLHIDRGCQRDGKFQYGGSDSCRDPLINGIINALWEKLPD